MKISIHPSRLWRFFPPIHRTLLSMAVIGFFSIGPVVSGQTTHELPVSGMQANIEAEEFSATSPNFPYAVDCPKCSGGQTVGYFGQDSWFEFDVNVPAMLNYQISFRAASMLGSRIAVQIVDNEGQTTLTTIRVPRSRSWRHYRQSRASVVTLPAGTKTIRFKNLGAGVNIDYVTFGAGGQMDIVRQLPEVGSGPDINPMKGFGSSWWRENEDHASVGFQYIEWGRLEPVDDEFDWAYVEEVLDRPGSRGRHFILQFVVDWDWSDPVDANYLGPQWLLDRVGEERGTADPNDPTSRQMRATRYNDPIFIEEAIEAINAISDRYQDDPRTFILQVGVLGFWGEWHTFPRDDWSPTTETKQNILNTFLNNLGSDGLTQVRYPDEPVNVPHPGMGYTNGSATPTPHGYEFGIQIAEQELWKFGPVGGEWPPGVETEFWQNFFLTNEGEFFLRQGGYSTMTPPEAWEIQERLPSWTMDGLYMDMHRLMGYTFQANEVRYLTSRDQTGTTFIEVDLENTGIAPFYKDWTVQLGVFNVENGQLADLIKTNTDIRTLGAGETITITGSTSEQLDPQGNYEIRLRIMQPGAENDKLASWNLNARNVYIVLANDEGVVAGEWDENHALQGGWNILGELRR